MNNATKNRLGLTLYKVIKRIPLLVRPHVPSVGWPPQYGHYTTTNFGQDYLEAWLMVLRASQIRSTSSSNCICRLDHKWVWLLYLNTVTSVWELSLEEFGNQFCNTQGKLYAVQFIAVCKHISLEFEANRLMVEITSDIVKFLLKNSNWIE